MNKFTEDDEKAATKKEPGLAFSFSTFKGGDSYMMSNFGRGATAGCWMDEAKTVGLQLMHSVKRLDPTEDESLTFTIDFVFRDLKTAMRALKIHQKNPFDLGYP